MKKSVVLAAFALAIAAPVGFSMAASNKDRIGIGNRKSEEQAPRASETRQFCTEAAARNKAPGKVKEVGQEADQAVSCSENPVSRTAEEARAEARKVERSPDN